MNTKALVFALAAVCFGSATPAFAQDYDRGDNRRYEQSERRHNDYSDGRRGDDRGRYAHDRSDRHDRHDRYNRHDRHDRYDRRDYHREQRREIRQEVRHYNQHYRGAGPRYDLYRGGRLPNAYYGDRYVVRDYHRYNLSAPHRGHHWVRAGNDYLLVAVATGLIAQVLLN